MSENCKCNTQFKEDVAWFLEVSDLWNAWGEWFDIYDMFDTSDELYESYKVAREKVENQLQENI